MLTEVQKQIIRDICSIQYTSLVDILTKPDLGYDQEGNKWEDVLIDFGVKRGEFDSKLIDVLGRFEGISKIPEKLENANVYDLSIFLKILVDFRGKWYKKYPSGYVNLLNKVKSWANHAEITNKP